MNYQTRKFNEKKIENALSATRVNRNTYSIIVIIFLIFGNTAGFLPLSGTSIFLYEPKYQCKGKNGLYKECKKEFVCDSKNVLNQDYFPDKNNVELKSLISYYDIYCDKPKIVLLSTAFFLGGLIGIILVPFMISSLGCLNTLLIGYLMTFISMCLIAGIQNFFAGIIFYIFFIISYSLIVITTPNYIIEMSEPSSRSWYIFLHFISFGTAGYLSVFIAYFSKDFRYILIVGAFIILVSGILLKYFATESVRTLFIQGKENEMIDALEHIAKINKSELEFKVWKENNIIAQPRNSVGKSNKFNEVSFLSVWKYKSQVKKIIVFSITSFIANYAVLLINLELKKQSNFYASLGIAFTSDLIGLFIGSMSTEIPMLGRKISFFTINLSCIIAFFFTGIVYNEKNILIHALMRVVLYSLFSNYAIYNFEIYPTMTRPICVSINRIFSRVFNLWTPYIMISFTQASYFLAIAFCLSICIMVCVFDFEETRKEKIQEFPPELEGTKKDDDDEEELFKEK